MLLGFSILLASITFLFYRHPQASWSLVSWLYSSQLQDVSEHGATHGLLEDETNDSETSKAVAMEETTVSVVDDSLKDLGAASREYKSSKEEGVEEVKEKADEEPASSSPTRAEADRRAMPPPPIFKNTAATKLRSPEVPILKVESPVSRELSVPSFPSLSSIQRASGGRGPPRSPLPNRGPPMAFSSSLAPPPSHNAVPSKPSRKVLLTPGHSPLDWARLAASPTANLRGLPQSTPYLRVPPSLLKQMTGRKGNDAWTVLSGKVYNITPYVPYHPGGEPELMKCAGRDGTRLFAEVHPWVNWEGMLEPCMVGIAISEAETTVSSVLEEMD